jgi:hypothetical protein
MSSSWTGGPVARWLDTVVCNTNRSKQYVDVFKRYGFDTLHDICKLDVTQLMKMGVMQIDCEKIMENVSVLKQTLQVSSNHYQHQQQQQSQSYAAYPSQNYYNQHHLPQQQHNHHHSLHYNQITMNNNSHENNNIYDQQIINRPPPPPTQQQQFSFSNNIEAPVLPVAAQASTATTKAPRKTVRKLSLIAIFNTHFYIFFLTGYF